jgi:biopolymer transport protein ExbB
MGFFDFIKNNLGYVIPLLVAGIIALAIIIERIRTLFVIYPMKNAAEFFDQVTTYVFQGKTKEAIALCDQYPTKPLARLAKAGLHRAHLPENLIGDGLEISLGDSNHAIQKRTAYLATIANVATLIGLFGTVAGLIASFEAVGHADAQQKSAMLAAGISTALNATLMGLGIAIPAMVCFSFLISRANKMSGELENGAVRMMDILKQRFYQSEMEPLSLSEFESTPSQNEGTHDEALHANGSAANVVAIGR